MSEQQDFFSANHKRLLHLATWAKYLAWVVLVVQILAAFVNILPYQFGTDYLHPFPRGLQMFLMTQPYEAFRLLINMGSAVLRGIIYYLVLKGISLGLNMIDETDINYREREQKAGAQ